MVLTKIEGSTSIAAGGLSPATSEANTLRLDADPAFQANNLYVTVGTFITIKSTASTAYFLVTQTDYVVGAFYKLQLQNVGDATAAVNDGTDVALVGPRGPTGTTGLTGTTGHLSLIHI